MELTIILISSAISLVLLAAALGMIVLSDPAVNLRLARFGGRAGKATGRALVHERMDIILRRVGGVAGRGSLEGAARASLRAKLIRAGFYADNVVEVFYAIRVFAALGLGLLGTLVAFVVHPPSTLLALLLILAFVSVGLYAPNLLLRQRIAERSRAIRFGLPDAVDLMVVCLEAGGTLSSALQLVQSEFGDLHPVIAEHLGIALVEMQAGSSRADALMRLADRTGSDEISALVTMLTQSEALGASVAQTLRVFADQTREARYLDAEKRANELPVKLTFPLVLFIFPSLMTVIFTPLVIRIVRVLLPIGQH
jgi:tight adherence protein C